MEEMTVSSLLPPHYALSVLDKNGHDSMHTEGWVRDKSCLVTIDTGAAVNDWQARHHSRAPWERPAHKVHPANGIRRHPPQFEGATNNLGVYHWNRPLVHPGTWCRPCSWCICGFEMPYATTGEWGSAIVEPWNTTTFNSLCEGEQWHSSSSVW
jgi:hypothetical protein